MYLLPFFKLIRVHHYIKNLFIVLPFFFAGRIDLLFSGTAPLFSFISFCFIASSIYVLNDIIDIEADKLHPEKSDRPLAKGLISIPYAIITGIALLGGGIILAYTISNKVLALVLSYFILNIFYSFWLKRIAIFDVFCVSLGFVIRVLVGGFAGDMIISKWLVMMVFLLSLGLVLGKRYDDLLLLDKQYSEGIRKVIKKYNLEFIRNALVFVFSISTMCYILYSMDPANEMKFHSHYFYLTSFPVILGVLRYFAIVFIDNKSASPVKIAMKDGLIIFSLFIWLLMFLFFIYVKS
jgi:decaprenyl-phosphate phosphoribosyltransferase